MENKSVINIKNLVKRFPVGGDYFTALQQIDLELLRVNLLVLSDHQDLAKQLS